MDPTSLPTVGFTINVEAFIGTTRWVCTSDQKPPTAGWWSTRRKSSPKLLQPCRRWWNGHWSKPVTRRETDDEAEDLAFEATTIPDDDIEWCGLLEAHPDGYPYRRFHV